MAILTPLVPVFLCILIGLAMTRTGFPGGKEKAEDFWRPLERLNYFILLPVLLFENLATADLSGVDVMPLGLSLVGAQFAMTLLMVLVKLALKPDGPTYSSMFQGAVRWNGFIALGVTGALMGDNGIALTAIALAFMIPVANVLSVLVLSI